MAGFPIAVNTYPFIYSHTALACMEHLSGLGHQAFEIMVNSPHFSALDLEAEQRRGIPKLMADRNLRIVSFNVPMLDHNFVSPDPQVRRYSVDIYRALIDIAAEWAVPHLVIVPGKLSGLVRVPPDRVIQLFAEAMHELAPLAADAGVALVVENVPAGSFMPLADDLLRVLDQVGEPDIGIAYEIANAVFAKEDPNQGLRAIEKSGRLRLVHVFDTGLTQIRMDPVGTGVVSFAEVAETLRDIGYEGWSILCVISPTPEADILESRRRLAQWGWEAAPE